MNKVLLAVAALLLVASCAPYRSWGGPGWCSGGYWSGSGYYNAPADYGPYGGYGR